MISDVLWIFFIPGYDNMSNRLNLYGTFSQNPSTQANYEKIPGDPRLGGTEHVPGEEQYSSRLLMQWKTTLRNSYKQKRHRNMAIKCTRTLRGKNGLKKKNLVGKTPAIHTQQSKNVPWGIYQEKTEVRIWRNTSHKGNTNYLLSIWKVDKLSQ